MKTICSILKKIGHFINYTRLLFLNLIFLCIIFLIFITLNLSDNTVQIPDNSTLHLNFSGRIVEQKTQPNFSDELSKEVLETEQLQSNEYQVDEIIQAIRFARHDPKIKNILLELNDLQGASINHITDIGKALNKFKSSGKIVTAIGDNYSQSQYLLASYANNIYLNPQGLVFLQGFSVYRLYFKEALDNLLITPHIFKVGTYKSFVEPFTESKMSEASKLANSHWLNQLWASYIKTVVDERKDTSNITAESLSPSLSQLKESLQKVNGDTALYAKQVGLVDFLNFRFEIMDKLKEQAKSEGSKFNLISYDAYHASLPTIYEPQDNLNQIAVIHGDGEILSGNQNGNAIGGDSFSRLLTSALKDKNIKAVVIRLNTPGGSAFASEKIRQQVLALKRAGKKVVVSMGSVTASGGYWIASAADSIIAYPTTLTGSIGIFGMYASAEKALNKLGIYNDGVGTTPLSSLTPARALDPELAEIMQIGIEHGYQQFIDIVAEGRHMSSEEVDKVAQGRVWTGVDAIQLGLIDEFGNLRDAILKAAKLALLSDYSIKEVKPRVSTRQQMLNELFGFGVKILGETIKIDPIVFQTIDTVQSQAGVLTRFNDPQGRYVYCAMCQIQ